MRAASRALTEAANLVTGTIFVAVSGGLDSSFLLQALVKNRQPGWRLSVVHVNHGLRGEASDGDEAFVQNLARLHDLPFIAKRLSWEDEKPSQAACRRRRREFFRQVAAAPGDRIFLAHHQDDQAETLLLKMIRGSGLQGLRGMAADDGFYVRPLLKISRARIEAEAKKWELEWREDASNQSLKYERNWLRLEILPQLEARRPGVIPRLAALAEEAKALPRPASFSHYQAPEGWILSRPDAGTTTGALASFFRLSRAHAESLRALLQKSHGRLEAEGVRFHWSAGCLLSEPKGVRLRAELVWEPGAVHSCWGAWKVPEGFRPALSTGERAKKAFQRAGIPLFLRAALPWIAPNRLLLPASAPDVEFAPSDLARYLARYLAR